MSRGLATGAAERKEGAAVIPILLRAGSEVNVQCDEPEWAEGKDEETIGVRTPLLYAVEEASAEGVRLLLGAGADVNAADHKGNTALHLLANQCWWKRDFDVSLVMLLLDAGASPEAKNAAGKTPLELIPDDQRDDPPVPEVIKLLSPGPASAPG